MWAFSSILQEVLAASAKTGVSGVGRRGFNCDKVGGWPLFRVQGYVGFLIAEWIHFTLFWIIPPTIKLKVYTFGGLMNSATRGLLHTQASSQVWIYLGVSEIGVAYFWGPG